MKRISIVLVSFMWVFVINSIRCSAASNMDINTNYKYATEQYGDFITNGYNFSGIYYEVYGKEPVVRVADGIFVTRTVIFEGLVQPDTSLYLKEYINGIGYSGTLNLIGYIYNYNTNTTEAEYEGMLYKRIE